MILTPRFSAATPTILLKVAAFGFVGLIRKPIVEAFGATSWSNSSCFAANVPTSCVTLRQIAARSIEALDEPLSNRIDTDGEDDRDLCGCRFCRDGRR